MYENKINLFEKAIEKNELLKFAKGEDEYFVLDREYDEHSVIQFWTLYIIPLMEEKSESYVNPFILQMLHEVIITNKYDEPTKYHLAWYHLHVYYYLRSEKQILGNIFKESHEIETGFYRFMDILIKTDKDRLIRFIESIKVIQSRGGIENMNVDTYTNEI